jgi:hypothetical protein
MPTRTRARSSGGIWFVVVMVAIVAGGVLFIAKSRGGPPRAKEPKGTQHFANLARNHVTEPQTYDVTPPVGGPHAGVWQNCGFYAEPIPPETGVHALEHGAVWITFRPDLPDRQVEKLVDIAKQPYLLVSPWPDLPSPVIASAWGRQLRLQSVDDDRLGEFIKAFVLGPQAPESGSPCTGGFGVPR